MAKWIKKWKVQGNSGNIWTVALDKDGNYGCSCPVWKFRRQECYHIKFIKTSKPKPDMVNKLEKPEIRFYNIEKPEYDPKLNIIKCPLVPMSPPNYNLEVLIDVCLMKHGYSWGEIHEIRHLPSSWTKRVVMAYYNNTKEG